MVVIVYNLIITTPTFMVLSSHYNPAEQFMFSLTRYTNGTHLDILDDDWHEVEVITELLQRFRTSIKARVIYCYLLFLHV